MKKIKTAIIGMGSISPMHAAPLKHYKDIELAAVCDIKADRAEKAGKQYNAAAYTDYKKMIEEIKPDALHICTPHYLHAPMTKFALERGINVLSEKPMTIKLEEGAENIALADRKNLKYGVIFQSRYNTASRLVKKYLDDGSLGKIISARSVLTWGKPDSYYMLSDWKGTWEKEGGGVIIDQAIHSIDLVNWFIADSALSVFAHIENRNHSIMEVDDSAEGLVKYKGGAVYGFWAMNNYGCDEPIEIRLYCQKGRATLTYNDAKIELNSGEIITVTQQDEDANLYEGGKEYWGFQHGKQIRQFYDAVLGKAELEITAKEAYKTQLIVNAIYQSSKTGKEIILT